MIDTLLNIHFYLMLNAALAIAYLISQIVLNFPYLKMHISYSQRLKYARFTLFFTMLIFLLMPSISSWLPSEYHSNFHLEPMLRSASENFLSYNEVYNNRNIATYSNELNFSINNILIATLLVCISIFFIRYIKNLMTLKKLKKASFCQHKINNIYILFNSETDIPFCWGYFHTHFISLPHSMLEKHEGIKLSVRHELQHIRQGDTNWLHAMAILKCICFWNPLVWLWIKWLEELQELSCDEAIILRNKEMPRELYAQNLINVAKDSLKQTPDGVLGIHNLSRSFFYRRVTMLFNYKPCKTRNLSILFVYFILLCSSFSAAYAFNGSTPTSSLSYKQITTLVEKAHIDKQFLTDIKPEVVDEINNIRHSDQARTMMQTSLQRMKKYQPTIQKALVKESLPHDILVLPLVESGYQPLDQSKNPVLAAGIWQIIPETAKRLGLSIQKNQDDRLNTVLSTKAALAYLKSNYAYYQDWRLALVAYEIGEKNTDRLIKETGSRDVWVLANAATAPKDLKKFLAMLEASLIIMHNPSLIA